MAHAFGAGRRSNHQDPAPLLADRREGADGAAALAKSWLASHAARPAARAQDRTDPWTRAAIRAGAGPHRSPVHMRRCGRTTWLRARNHAGIALPREDDGGAG